MFLAVPLQSHDIIRPRRARKVAGQLGSQQIGMLETLFNQITAAIFESYFVQSLEELMQTVPIRCLGHLMNYDQNTDQKQIWPIGKTWRILQVYVMIMINVSLTCRGKQESVRGGKNETDNNVTETLDCHDVTIPSLTIQAFTSTINHPPMYVTNLSFLTKVLSGLPLAFQGGLRIPSNIGHS